MLGLLLVFLNQHSGKPPFQPVAEYKIINVRQ